MPPQSVRLTGFAVLFIGSIMWTAFEKWDTEVIRADTAQQTLALRMRQQFPGFPIGYSSSALVHTFESTGWVRLNTPVVRYDWSTVPPDADVFATVYVGMYGGDRNRRSCRAARVRVRDVGTDTVAGESERIPYVPNTNQRQVVRIRLDRRTMLASYALEVASETKDCPINGAGRDTRGISLISVSGTTSWTRTWESDRFNKWRRFVRSVRAGWIICLLGAAIYAALPLTSSRKVRWSVLTMRRSVSMKMCGFFRLLNRHSSSSR